MPSTRHPGSSRGRAEADKLRPGLEYGSGEGKEGYPGSKGIRPEAWRDLLGFRVAWRVIQVSIPLSPGAHLECPSRVGQLVRQVPNCPAFPKKTQMVEIKCR